MLGCQPTQHTDFSAFVQEPRPTVVGQDYTVGVPDELVVTVMSDRGVEEIVQTLGPDGKLRLKGFGIVQAAGQTTTEITETLNEIAQTTDGIHSLAVRVQTFASQKVFVFGQVESTGGQAYHGTNSVLEVVAAAKPNLRADVRNVQVLRPSPDGEFRRQMTVDLDAMVRGGDTTLDVVLAEGDIVFVPPTALGSIGLTFQQLFGGTPQSAPQPEPAPREVAVMSSVELPEPEPAVVENIHRTDAQTLEELVALREALAELAHQLQETREADAAWLAAWEEKERQAELERSRSQVVFYPRTHLIHTSAQEEPSPHTTPTVYTTADVQRGGAGEDASPEGVRFWGP
ncbi:polysaccharide biosynthesis/export family protein [Algisphaera agarilytica]|uniref:Protein involved in polysaccharide export with SLBB domain n=1 Tax=Algisphaera agarilytica TaxID=1385975 RepID=A0A7X0LLC2_9BACT|nr:polysaccharide biosynthesis/export family protein [Algisphaera agarilytica]MBB6430862.1 protein involved in polysaccharide export with SLBB domain [Algisphaera agarilytica]